MKVTVVGKGDEELTQKDYITQGGEGKIYVKKGTVFKIHDDPSKMIPVDKIRELTILDRPNIIRPENIVLKGNKPVGYTMKYIKDAFSLCQAFTKAFKKRYNLDEKNIVELVKIMQKTIDFIHSKDILIVDLNEMNFLINDKFDDVFFIDVNSYQTRHYPATAIMESIRDRHCNGIFTRETDWFSFGIVSFQLFIGIHPYKGKHASIGNMDERMKSNVSVFNNAVSMPPVCYPLDIIPISLRNWYEGIFEKGERTAPPMDFTAIKVVIKAVPYISGSKNLEILLLKAYDGEIIAYSQKYGSDVVITDKGFVYHKGTFHQLPQTKNVQIGFTPKMNFPIIAYVENSEVKIFDVINNKHLHYIANGSDIMSHDGRIYYQNGDQIIEVQFTEIKDNIFATSKVVGTVLERSAKMFEGVIIQSMLGDNNLQTYFLSIFPEAGTCYQFFVPELGEYRVINAKFQNKILMLIGINNKTGKYDRFILKLTDDYKSYELTKVEDISLADLNFVVLDNGICVMLNEEGKIQIFNNKIPTTQIKVVDDPIGKQDIKLFTDGSKVLFAKNNEMHSMRMK